MEVYLDNSATTRAFDEVAELVAQVMTKEYGNPSSVHHMGTISGDRLIKSREMIAGTLKVDPSEILFTSGGTESDNTAIIGVARANAWRGKHIITSAIEHPAVFESLNYLEKEGFEITRLKVDSEGKVSLDELKNAIREDTILVSIMLVNNEIGTIEPVSEFGNLIKSVNKDTYFHVDATQGFGKLNDELRSGTENVPGIAGLALASKMCYEDFDAHIEKLYELKEHLVSSLTEKITDIKFNGPAVREGAPHIVSLSIKGLAAETVLNMLSSKNIYVSAGSACASNNPHVSDTLRSIGLASDLLESTIRISMSVLTTREEIDYFIETLSSQVETMRKFYRH